MITVALAAALITVAWSLWTRRHTWRNPWEKAANLTIVFQATALTLTSPAMSSVVSKPLHQLFGVWNFEDFIGNSFYVASSAAIVWHALSRFTPETGQNFRASIRHIIAASLLIQLVLFACSRGARTPVANFMALPGGPYLAAYWWVLCGTTAAILAYAGRFYWQLCQDPLHRKTAVLYLCFLAIGIFTCITRMAQAAIIGGDVDLATGAWLGCCVAVTGFAYTFARSWKTRARQLV